MNATRPPVRAARLCGRFVAGTFPILALTTPAHAQEHVVLRGQVVEAESLEPLPGVHVMAPLSERTVLTDSLGAFSISFIRDTHYELMAGAMGYEVVRMTVGPEAVGAWMTIELSRDEEALAGLAVLHERLEQRRRRRGNFIRLIEHEELALSDESSAFELVRQVTVAQLCSDQRDLCKFGGSRVRICIDDQYLNNGARDLEAYEPADLWLIEMSNNRRRVWVYSRWFIDQVARTRQGEIKYNPIC